jgi:hypothetical protein
VNNTAQTLRSAYRQNHSCVLVVGVSLDTYCTSFGSLDRDSRCEHVNTALHVQATVSVGSFESISGKCS